MCQLFVSTDVINTVEMHWLYFWREINDVTNFRKIWNETAFLSIFKELQYGKWKVFMNSFFKYAVSLFRILNTI